MNNKTALLVAIALGVLSVLGIHFYIQKLQRQIVDGQELIEVLVSSTSLNAGAEISADSIKTIKVPLNFVRKLRGSEVKDKKLLLRAKIRTDIDAGQIFQTYHVNQVSAEIQALKVPEKYRAITIPVDPVTGVGGMLQPGDFVDLAGSVTSKKLKINGVAVPEYSGMLLQHLVILAVDQRTSKDAKDFRFGYKTITLRVTPAQGIQIAHIITNGSVYLMKSPEGVDINNKTKSFATSTDLIVNSWIVDIGKKMRNK